ncbi:hypothetical protein N7539_008362 [Penicillium diatomitis]|uniref:Uncharacterized protein n=1 Tax=Penicillium diatomitis TaxID=2819901 RepID=A0A9W9WTK6_9EURO|nr:uncharacterized protein N7539_008362 [Penicillium diatomitis]KAJ5475296.1 hypothetical protein N7539_008362 [Penicillium diatomitis]
MSYVLEPPQGRLFVSSRGSAQCPQPYRHDSPSPERGTDLQVNLDMGPAWGLASNKLSRV